MFRPLTDVAADQWERRSGPSVRNANAATRAGRGGAPEAGGLAAAAGLLLGGTCDWAPGADVRGSGPAGGGGALSVAVHDFPLSVTEPEVVSLIYFKS